LKQENRPTKDDHRICTRHGPMIRVRGEGGRERGGVCTINARYLPRYLVNAQAGRDEASKGKSERGGGLWRRFVRSMAASLGIRKID